MEDENYSEEAAYGSRLLDMNDRHLVVEVPTDASAKQAFKPEAPIFVVMVHRSTRLELACKIEDRIKFSINEKVQTIGYQISYPKRIGSAQRRAYFRAHVTAMPIAPIQFLPLDPVLKHPMYELKFQGKLVNISGGGMGVIVQKDDVPILRDCKFFDCELLLPMDKEHIKFTLQCQSMHATAGRKGDVYVGLQFKIADPLKKREVVDKLVKYTAWIQREQLKNQHDKT
jgi:c-di-GMP-binding flagellar brake protein YcgR